MFRRVLGRVPRWLLLGCVNRSRVHQHDRDVVLNRVHTAAFAAFQTSAIRIQDDSLLANRADQHVKQILVNHSGYIVARTKVQRSL